MPIVVYHVCDESKLQDIESCPIFRCLEDVVHVFIVVPVLLVEMDDYVSETNKSGFVLSLVIT